jgi:hypothetical protein
MYFGVELEKLKQKALLPPTGYSTCCLGIIIIVDKEENNKNDANDNSEKSQNDKNMQNNIPLPGEQLFKHAFRIIGNLSRRLFYVKFM